MQVNKEFFATLSELKQNFIENAFNEAKEEIITINEFFERCSQVLTEYEFNTLFLHDNTEQNYQEKYSKSTQELYEKNSKVNNNYVDMHAKSNNSSQTNDVKIQNNKKYNKKEDDNIDDIMPYTGVNLKDEADYINKYMYNNYAESYSGVDLQNVENSFETLFNIKLFEKYLNNCCANRKIKITEDGVNLIFLLLYRKIMNLIDRLDEASKIRSEFGITLNRIQIKNEHNKQIWYLNELEKNKFEKLNMQADKDKKKKQIQEREDLLIKKKQSNSIAMAAMGVKQKSWMNKTEKIEEVSKYDSIYSPVDDKLIGGKNRSIIFKDFLFILERDKRYNKSIFLLSQYYKDK